MEGLPTKLWVYFRMHLSGTCLTTVSAAPLPSVRPISMMDKFLQSCKPAVMRKLQLSSRLLHVAEQDISSKGVVNMPKRGGCIIKVE
ncbi:hypothetical protein DAI22_08g157166 [Oryza sativa Japonica Group]|nr:hypothetical protein DAI22_08g157166 [Oryza sativa Japonica Group]